MGVSFTRPGTDEVNTGTIDLSSVTAWSCGAWVYYDGSGTNEHTVITNWVGTTNRAKILLRIDPNTTDRIELLFGDSAGSDVVINGTGAVPVDKWAFVGATFEGGVKARIYLNGVEGGSSTPAATMATTASTADLLIGNADFTANDDFGGRIAEAFVAVGETFTASQMLAIANGQMRTLGGRLTDAESRYLPLYGNSSTEPDLSRNANNGTVTGASKIAHAPVRPYSSRYWGSAFVIETATTGKTRSYCPGIVS